MTTLEEIRIEVHDLTAADAQAVLDYIHELKTGTTGSKEANA